MFNPPPNKDEIQFNLGQIYRDYVLHRLGYICRYASDIWITREQTQCSIMHTENNMNIKHKSFQGFFTPREQQYGLTLQQWVAQSRSLSVLMITLDLFSANMYFKVNNRVLLMLQPHQKRICNYFIIAQFKSSSIFLVYWQPVDIYLWLYCAVKIIYCCVASGSGIYLSTAYRRVYICLCDSPISHRPAGSCKKHNLKRTGKNRQYITTALIIHFRGIVDKCYFSCVLSISWSVHHRPGYCCAWPERWPYLAEMAWYTQTIGGWIMETEETY